MIKKKKKNGWFETKSYLHFDYPISLKKASEIVENPYKVSRHSFLPFLRVEDKQIKAFFDKEKNKLIKKEKIRPISYSSHIDSHIYSFYAKNLSEKYEEILEKKNFGTSVLAFRKIPKTYTETDNKKFNSQIKCVSQIKNGHKQSLAYNKINRYNKNKQGNKSNIEFAKEAFDEIKNFGESVVLAYDFSKFFDTLDHELLKKQWSKVLNCKKLPEDHFNIYKSLTKFSFVKRDEVFSLFEISKHNPKPKHKSGKLKKKISSICSIEDFRNKVRGLGLINVNEEYSEKKGIPQGSALSGLLSNIYMLDFDEKVHNFLENLNGKYYRYCDDILIIVKPQYLKRVKNFVQIEVKSLRTVELNTKKTEITYFLNRRNRGLTSLGINFKYKPMQYLGFMFDGQNISIRSSSIAKFHRKMNRAVRLAKKHLKK